MNFSSKRWDRKQATNKYVVKHVNEAKYSCVSAGTSESSLRIKGNS